MDHLVSHRTILKLATADQLPDRINESSEISVAVTRELIDEGYLRAIDVCSKDGDEYLDPKITVSGREYLNALTARAEAASPRGKARAIGLRLLDWAGGIIAGIVIGLVVGKAL